MNEAPLTYSGSDAPTAETLAAAAPDDALRQLMAAYGDEIHRFCLSMVRQPDTAQDLLQQTFIKAYTNLKRFEGRSTPRTWLYTIARNQCLDELRKSKRHLAVVEYRSDVPQSESSHDTAASAVDGNHLSRALASCMDKARADVRAAITLRFQHEHSFPEMARITGQSAKKLQAQVSRALPALRTCLKNAGVEL